MTPRRSASDPDADSQSFANATPPTQSEEKSMFGNALFQVGYDNYIRRTGIEPSPEAEARYREETEANIACSRADEARSNQEQAAHFASLPMKAMPFIKAGRLRENTSSGSIVHLVMSNGDDDGHDGAYPRAALCGDAPAIGWSDADGRETTCPKCRRRLASTAD
ncbi:hypothetical protein [Jiella pelagia]|uniref:Uncharacterized protein n=1 Tax=Jiella pelagia TaxID=2986949 RepID=A0ABY7C0A2_9HYPH|nr:hypothetical protein [Jiella pelagia]WAP69113.1 hypothetical protein OH818_01930 [Jiella pelagia]